MKEGSNTVIEQYRVNLDHIQRSIGTYLHRLNANSSADVGKIYDFFDDTAGKLEVIFRIHKTLLNRRGGANFDEGVLMPRFQELFASLNDMRNHFLNLAGQGADRDRTTREIERTLADFRQKAARFGDFIKNIYDARADRRTRADNKPSRDYKFNESPPEDIHEIVESFFKHVNRMQYLGRDFLERKKAYQEGVQLSSSAYREYLLYKQSGDLKKLVNFKSKFKIYSQYLIKYHKLELYAFIADSQGSTAGGDDEVLIAKGKALLNKSGDLNEMVLKSVDNLISTQRHIQDETELMEIQREVTNNRSSFNRGSVYVKTDSEKRRERQYVDKEHKVDRDLRRVKGLNNRITRLEENPRRARVSKNNSEQDRIQELIDRKKQFKQTRKSKSQRERDERHDQKVVYNLRERNKKINYAEE